MLHQRQKEFFCRVQENSGWLAPYKEESSSNAKALTTPLAIEITSKVSNDSKSDAAICWQLCPAKANALCTAGYSNVLFYIQLSKQLAQLRLSSDPFLPPVTRTADTYRWSAAQSSKEGLQALPCTTCNLHITACPAGSTRAGHTNSLPSCWQSLVLCLGLASKADLKPKGPLYISRGYRGETHFQISKSGDCSTGAFLSCPPTTPFSLYEGHSLILWVVMDFFRDQLRIEMSHIHFHMHCISMELHLLNVKKFVPPAPCFPPSPSFHPGALIST